MNENQHLPDREIKSLSKTINEWITDNGSSLKKAPYLRKDLEKEKPDFTPEGQGYKSLTAKLARNLAESGFSLNMPRNMEKLTDDERKEIMKQEEDRILNLLINR